MPRAIQNIAARRRLNEYTRAVGKRELVDPATVIEARKRANKLGAAIVVVNAEHLIPLREWSPGKSDAITYVAFPGTAYRSKA